MDQLTCGDCKIPLTPITRRIETEGRYAFKVKYRCRGCGRVEVVDAPKAAIKETTAMATPDEASRGISGAVEAAVESSPQKRGRPAKVSTKGDANT